MPDAFGHPIPSMAVLRNRDERLQSLKDLVARLAHDFNNSLVPLTGYVTLLKEELKPETPSTQFYALFNSSSQPITLRNAKAGLVADLESQI